MKKIITILALLALLASCGANTTPTDNPITIIPGEENVSSGEIEENNNQVVDNITPPTEEIGGLVDENKVIEDIDGLLNEIINQAEQTGSTTE